MGRRELGDYSGKFNRKRESSIFDASTGVSAFLFLKNASFSGAVGGPWCIVTADTGFGLSASGFGKWISSKK
jgi:hypothetical protein